MVYPRTIILLRTNPAGSTVALLVCQRHYRRAKPPQCQTMHTASTKMYSLTFLVHCYAVMCTNCQYAQCYVVIVTKPVQRSNCKSAQKCTTRGHLYHSPKLHLGPWSSVGMQLQTNTHTDRRPTDGCDHYIMVTAICVCLSVCVFVFRVSHRRHEMYIHRLRLARNVIEGQQADPCSAGNGRKLSLCIC